MLPGRKRRRQEIVRRDALKVHAHQNHPLWTQCTVHSEKSGIENVQRTKKKKEKKGQLKIEERAVIKIQNVRKSKILI